MKGKTTIWLLLAMGALALSLLFGSVEADGATQTEKRIAEVLGAIHGAGQVEVALFYTAEESAAFSSSANAKPTGAVIVAQGAADMQVRLQLIRAVRTLLGLDENAVDVFVMEEGRR